MYVNTFGSHIILPWKVSIVSKFSTVIGIQILPPGSTNSSPNIKPTPSIIPPPPPPPQSVPGMGTGRGEALAPMLFKFSSRISTSNSSVAPNVIAVESHSVPITLNRIVNKR